MFDISLGELTLIAVIALVVLGPERLPRVARTAGMLLRKARRSWNTLRDEIEREVNAEEMKRQLKAATDLNSNSALPCATDKNPSSPSVISTVSSSLHERS